uniref:Uncharacterized protein n=1 Tax=Aegilops tauschii subsp. strangulata TaxID=200361 RepID=A0A453QDZ6_AEGTS
MGIVGSFPFNSFLSGVLSCIGTAVLGGLPPYPSQQGQQGIQGSSPGKSLC